MIFFLRDHKCGFKLGKGIAYYYNDIINKDIELLTFYSANKKFVEENDKHKFVIFIRHPKEIIVSGYLYHKICKEEWCIKKNGFYYENFDLKQFEKTKIELAKTFSENKSYQNKIKKMNQNEGLLHELKNVGYLTLSGLNDILDIDKPNVLFLDVEQYTFDSDNTVDKLFKFLKMNDDNNTKHLRNTLEIKTNVKNRNKITNHITNKNFKLERYKDYWFDELENELYNMFPNLIQKYEDKIL